MTTIPLLVKEPSDPTALRRRNKLLYAICSQAADGILVVELKSRRTVMANIALCDMLGFEPDEMMNMSADDIILASDYEPGLDGFSRFVGRETSRSRDIPLRRKDGRIMYSDITTALVEVTGQQLVIGIIRDVTDMYQVRRAVQISHQMLEMVNRHTDREKLLEDCVSLLVRETGCRMAGIRLIGDDNTVPYRAQQGIPPEFVDMIDQLSLEDDSHMCIRVVTGKVDKTLPYCTHDGSFFVNSISRLLPGLPKAEKQHMEGIHIRLGVESAALIPIKVEGWIIGLIHLADARENMVPLDEVMILEKVALQLGDAVKRLQVERDLIKAYAGMEVKVEERTRELKEANERLMDEVWERTKAEEKQRSLAAHLKKQKEEIEQKALALREVIGQVEVEKNRFKDDIAANVNEVALPLVNRLEAAGLGAGIDDIILNSCINALRHHLNELVTSFGRKITEKELRLTPREVEICSLIKSGLDSKEIADVLSISRQTVFKHRDRIRRKLKLDNTGINLTTYLQSL